jgi:DNA (cytosine-5)-methyltransferase 1
MSKNSITQLSIFDFLNKENDVLNIATLCSGIGTPEIAFNELSIKTNIVFACEIDDFARETYKANHKIKDEDFHKDIALFNATKYLGHIHILIFGSPCQPFSIRGYRKGFEDPRGKVFFDGINRIEECQPEVVIFENVKGLVNHEKGETFEIVKSEFERIGYFIAFKIFNALNHDSIQKRERIFLFAFKNKDKKHEFNIDDIKIQESTLFLEDYLEPIEEVDEKYWLSSTAREMMDEEVKDSKRIAKGLYLKDRWEHCNINESTNKEAYTITASFCKGHPNNVLIDQRGCKYGFWTCDLVFTEFCESCDYDEGCCNFQFNNFSTPACRKLTPRECARIQNIPDSFLFPVSDFQAYRQIGNSMDINVLKVLLLKVFNINFKELTISD